MRVSDETVCINLSAKSSFYLLAFEISRSWHLWHRKVLPRVGKTDWFRKDKTEPVFVNLLRSPGIDS
jgi:hypothetical protein